MLNLTAGVAIRFTLAQWKLSLSYVQDLRIMGQFNVSFRLTQQYETAFVTCSFSGILSTCLIKLRYHEFSDVKVKFL